MQLLRTRCVVANLLRYLLGKTFEFGRLTDLVTLASQHGRFAAELRFRRTAEAAVATWFSSPPPS